MQLEPVRIVARNCWMLCREIGQAGEMKQRQVLGGHDCRLRNDDVANEMHGIRVGPRQASSSTM